MRRSGVDLLVRRIEDRVRRPGHIAGREQVAERFNEITRLNQGLETPASMTHRRGTGIEGVLERAVQMTVNLPSFALDRRRSLAHSTVDKCGSQRPYPRSGIE